MCDPQTSPERLESSWLREKQLFAKLIYNANSKIARRARFLDCFQEWLEQEFFKVVWTEIIRQLGLFRCFPMCTKKVWLDPRIPDGGGGPPVVPVFCKKSCFISIWKSFENTEVLRVFTGAAAYLWETFLRREKLHRKSRARISWRVQGRFVTHVSRTSRTSRPKWRTSRSKKQKLRFGKFQNISHVVQGLKYATVAFVFRHLPVVLS